MTLLGKPPQKEIGKRLKILLFGDAGVGKTTSAIQLPNSYIVDCEKGTVAYYKEIADKNSVVFYSNDPIAIEAEIDKLLTEKHQFTTLVIDPITTIYAQIQTHWDHRFQIAKGNKENDLEDYGMRFWTKVKKDHKRIREKLLTLDMNIIVTCHQKDQYGKNQQIIGVTADTEKSDRFIYDYVFRLIKRGKKYIALTEKQRVPIGKQGFPNEFEWNYNNLIKFYGKEEIIRLVDNTSKESVDKKVDNIPSKPAENQELNDKIELLKVKLKENNINAKDFKIFLNEVAKWQIPSLTKITLKQVTTLIDEWAKVLPKFNTFIENTKSMPDTISKDTPETKTETKKEKSEDKDKKSEDNTNKVKSKREAIKIIDLLLLEWKMDKDAFIKHLNIENLRDLDMNGLNSVINNFDTIRETIN